MPEEPGNPSHSEPNLRNSDQLDEFSAQSSDTQSPDRPEQFNPSTPDLQPSEVQSTNYIDTQSDPSNHSALIEDGGLNSPSKVDSDLEVEKTSEIMRKDAEEVRVEVKTSEVPSPDEAEKILPI